MLISFHLKLEAFYVTMFSIQFFFVVVSFQTQKNRIDWIRYISSFHRKMIQSWSELLIVWVVNSVRWIWHTINCTLYASFTSPNNEEMLSKKLVTWCANNLNHRKPFIKFMEEKFFRPVTHFGLHILRSFFIFIPSTVK